MCQPVTADKDVDAVASRRIDDRVGHAYSGMPDRLYLIDREGKVAYKGGRGPFGFKPAELEQSLVMLLIDHEGKHAPESATTAVTKKHVASSLEASSPPRPAARRARRGGTMLGSAVE